MAGVHCPPGWHLFNLCYFLKVLVNSACVSADFVYDWPYVTRYSCTTLADCPRSDSQGNWLQDSCFDPELDIEEEESFI